jgi:molecular chaperone DnaK (HSP70)
VRARDVSVSAASTAHEVRESVASAAVITYKWHKSALEHQCRKKRSRATKHADQALLQKKVAYVRRDESLLVGQVGQVRIFM